ncbi:hypothetical protein J4E90_006931 [Alternaria incomplexa]|uniref:uncharacterized protein n=1 Tax=Alternaria incomplexa TaxID=1187928 RepID=UPI00221FE5A9|nr:uncharacterized protein J4E90_006931 [Alternaria incomplexa]KAI4910676.1 hypothetical protein J4E90_006931 [Alternaria incomplexa]
MPPNTSDTSDLDRLFLIIDWGTTYGKMGRIHVPARQDVNSISKDHIDYLHGYDEDICPNDTHNDFVPTHIYYGQDGDHSWGWSVSRLLSTFHEEIHQNGDRLVRLSKLMLGDTDATLDVRNDLEKQLDGLKRDGYIHGKDDVMSDYFTEWFTFAKDQSFDMGMACPEFVISVPSDWGVTSCHRYYTAIVKAIVNVWNLQAPPSIITVSEPEAAASYCLSLEGTEVGIGSCVSVIDAGGGTIEMITLKKTRNDPVRWEQICPMSSDSHGGDSLNRVLRDIVTKKLASESYLGEQYADITVPSIVAGVVQKYESDIKRSSSDPTTKPPSGFVIQGLKSDPARGRFPHTLKLTSDEWIRVYKPAHDGLIKIIDEQHSLVVAKGERIDSVVWVGQFSDSKSFRAKEKRYMATWEHVPEHTDEKEYSTYAVTCGAGLKALKVKMFPPNRFLRAGFAIERHLPKQWNSRSTRFFKKHPQLRHLRKARGEPGDNGKAYIFNCLEYFAQKGDEFPEGRQYFFTSTHSFHLSKRWIAEEQIWYTPQGPKKSWYRSDDKENRDAKVLGTIHYDMSALKQSIGEEFRVGSEGDDFYEVTLRVMVEMRVDYPYTLNVKARWAPELTGVSRQDTDADDYANVDRDSREMLEGDDAMTFEGEYINVSAAFNISAV